VGEFDLIQRYFADQIQSANGVELGIGDDCALLNVPEGECLAVSTDTLVSGVHFFPDVDPFSLGYKSLAVNLSDLAAMGAAPRWVSLALTLPEVSESWLADFAKGFFLLADKHGVTLVGGDTTKGPLSITISVKGTVPPSLAMRRSGTKPGDFIYVSGTLGEAALAVQQRLHGLPLEPSAIEQFKKKLEFPTPRCELGMALRGIATSGLDLSDGLSGDLKHILKASKVSASVELSDLPISDELKQQVTPSHALQLALGGGDDYELCFTANAVDHEKVMQIAQDLNISLTKIGEIQQGEPQIHWLQQGKPVTLSIQGWEHF